MKIKSEFLPLIESGIKKYEFRNNDDKQGIYKLNDDIYLLSKYSEIYSKSIPNDSYKFFAEYVRNNYRKEVNSKNDKLTFKWMKEHDDYFRDGKENNIHRCYIYEGNSFSKSKLVKKELEGYVHYEFPLFDVLKEIILKEIIDGEKINGFFLDQEHLFNQNYNFTFNLKKFNNELCKLIIDCINKDKIQDLEIME